MKYLIAIALLAAFASVSTMSYNDAVMYAAYTHQMQQQGLWP